MTKKIPSDKIDYAIHPNVRYPSAIMLKYDDSFHDEDGIHYHYPAHKLITNPYSILVLVNRKAHYEVIDSEKAKLMKY